MGSQISNVRDIARGMREATRYFVELSQLGAVIDYVDVGGGLGIDYEGTRSRSYNSVNYGVAQYASSIVQPLADACAAHELPQPRIVTTFGRPMTAHPSVLLAHVSAFESAPSCRLPDEPHDEPSVLRPLRGIHAALAYRPSVYLFPAAIV